MKVLLTNDDGIDAPGLVALREAVKGLATSRVYAPSVVQSGCSHRLTTDDPIRIEHRANGEVSVHGTPGDCVRYAFHEENDFDWIFSGINEGGNLGVDVFYSGTVAAVREASIYGKPGIAFSHYIRRGIPLDWHRVAGWARKVAEILIERPHSEGMFWSVNFPHLEPGTPEPEIVFCPLDTNPMPLQFDRHDEGQKFSGIYSQRKRTPGADVDVCFSGRIAVTRLSTCHGCELTATQKRS
ncbi:5'/3'-nucleotidase SurE [bacterium]|nr:5'/3'-nucleotidase SurE [bacterium]